MSPYPPLRKIGKDALLEVGLLTSALVAYSPRLPIRFGTVAQLADFVAVYSCEGSGGISPHFPLPLTHRGYAENENALDLTEKIEGGFELLAC